MANTATKRSALSINLGGQFHSFKAIPVLVNYDTPNTDLTVSTPSANQSTLIIGLCLVSANASKLTLKSNSTTLTRLELANNSGIVQEVDMTSPKVICNTAMSEALKLNCDVALPPFILYIVEV